MKKILSFFMIVLTVSMLGACSQDNTDLKKITFVLDYTPNTNHTGVYVAKNLGYFAEEGIEVEIVQPPEDGADLMVASGKAQLGVSYQDIMAPGLVGDNPLPTTAIAALVQHNTSGILSRLGDGIDTPKGLEGKKYSTWNIPVEKAMIENVVTTDGGDFSKVTLVPSNVSDVVSALESKSVDALWVFEAWDNVAADLAGLKTDYFAFKDINPVFDYYTPVLIGNNNFLEDDPETVKAFLRATQKGYEYAIANPEEAANILLEEVPELSKDMVLKSQEFLKDQYKADVEQWGYISPERWNRFYNWLNENKLSEYPIPENTGFSNDYLPK